MLQLLQNLRTGKIELLDVPVPQLRRSHLLIQTSRSLISTGTERMLLEFGKASLIEKARQQPERMKQVMQKVKTDGLIHTIKAVRARLDRPLALGYCNVGTVIDGNFSFKALSFKKGDRVVSNGPHAEVVCVPVNLCARIPDNVDDETAVFTVPGAIALQGIRLLNPALGEYIVVIGLGLIGQLAIQLLISNGCNVLGVDIDKNKLETPEKFGANCLMATNDIVEKAISFSRGRGVDGVLICASTNSNKPIEQAAKMCRKRGRIVLIGVVGLNIPRDLFYKKELTFQVSCSYGPGRYDPQYEERGIDYPISYVRWTEQRNFEAVLDVMAREKINVRPLISHRIPFGQAEKAYDILLKENPLGIVLTYNEEVKKDQLVRLKDISIKTDPQKPVVGLIGAGNFTRQILLPILRKIGAKPKIIASSSGLSGTDLARKFGLEKSTTDVNNIFNDAEINTVFITTRHNTHARFVIDALKAKKHVYVEKPLCLNKDELKQIINIYVYNSQNHNSQLLMVGFNRRFSPCTKRIKGLLLNRKEPLCMSMIVNAGFIPSDHWTQDPEVGGGRIIGEACHFIDLLRFIADSPIDTVHAISTSGHPSTDSDKMVIMLTFKDGSIGTVHYFANGSKEYPKEKLEIFCERKTILLNNFKSVRAYGFGKRANLRLWRQDKGHENEIKAFLSAIEEGKNAPIPFDEIINVTLATFAAVESARDGNPIKVIAMTKDI